jgi:hypothetical protein
MSTSRPSQPQQNRQQPQSQHANIQQQHQSNFVQENSEEQPQKKEATVLASPKTFELIIILLQAELAQGKLLPQNVYTKLREWYDSLSIEDQQAFQSARVDNEVAINNLRGYVETIAQVVPHLYIQG